MLHLKHTKLDVYQVARQLVKETYILTASFPNEEKFSLTLQIRRAAMSIKLNIAEGSSRKSSIERKRYYEIARGSVIELDAAFESALDLQFITSDKLYSVETLAVRCFSMLTAMLSK